MAGKKSANAIKRVSDEAMRSKTGHTWLEWFELLDADEAASMDHKEIVAHIGRNHPGVSEWWRQMLTTGYEEARGLREKHQKPDGFEISRSKTIGVTVEKLFEAWSDTGAREQWLPGHEVTVRRATRDKSMRLTWSDGYTHVDASFYPRGDHKAQVAVQHRKLADTDAAEDAKMFWSSRLAELKKQLEG